MVLRLKLPKNHFILIKFHVSFDKHRESIDFHYFEQSLIYGMAKKRIL